MAQTIAFLSPDGQYLQNLNLSVQAASRVQTGTVPTGTVSVEISLNGSAFAVDTDLVLVTGSTFVIPNPSYASALPLSVGANTIAVRPVFSSGTGDTSTLVVCRVAKNSLDTLPPPSLTLVRQPGSVLLRVEEADDTRVVGYRIYGAVEAGGGAVGYSQLNLLDLTDTVSEEERVDLADLEVQQTLAVNQDGSLVADPTYLGITITQQKLDGTVVQTDLQDRSLQMSAQTSEYRAVMTVQRVNTRNYREFTHYREGTPTTTPPHITNGMISGLSRDFPVYYVAVAVYYDASTGEESESRFTAEVAGSPIEILPVVGTLPSVGRQQIVQDQIEQILSAQPDVAITVGSFTRDTYIDPFATEAARLRFILDFVQRCGSFTTLLEIDDPLESGTSIPVPQSSYKQALQQAFFLQTEEETQQIIDLAFEHLATRVGVTRLLGVESRGTLTIYLKKRPDQTYTIPIGTQASGGGYTFRTLASATIDKSKIASYYSAKTGRYAVTVAARADDVGEATNVSANVIRTLTNPISGLSVTNDSRFRGGTGRWSNRKLATEAMQRMAGSDTGTQQGLKNLVASVPGVREAIVVQQGSSLMKRTGAGKVDIWVAVNSPQTVTDSFALSYGVGRGVLMVPVNPEQTRWQIEDSRLTQANPFVAFLTGTEGTGMRNISSNLSFDTTGFTQIDYRTVELSTSVVQPAVADQDVVLVDFKFLQTSAYQMEQQPVDAIVSLTGNITGTISTYTLVTDQDPFQTGRSALATDNLVMSGYTVGQYTAVTGEPHVVLQQYTEYLDNLGIDSTTIVVKSLDGVTTYAGPTAATPDYTLVGGTATQPWGFKRVQNSTIQDGQTCIVQYQYAEKFTVEYQTDGVIQEAQRVVDAAKHVSADILLKACPILPINITATLLLNRQNSVVNLTPDVVAENVQANVLSLIDNIPVGGTLRQSEVIKAILSTEGVADVSIPLTTLALADGAQILQETLPWDLSSDATAISATQTRVVWLVHEGFRHVTQTGGAPVGAFSAVYGDDVSIPVYRSYDDVLLGPNRAYIVGAAGIVIQGYSDDTTLSNQIPGVVTPEKINALRQTLTGNHLIVSLQADATPTTQVWQVCYQVWGDTGARDIVAGPVGVLSLQSMTLPFDEVV